MAATPAQRVAVLSLHTSPLAQPGVGDGGGMNVYVRELTSSLARLGVECTTYTRAWKPGLPAVVDIDRKSTRLNSSHVSESRMPSSA